MTKQYREVSRKAAVGERIKIVAAVVISGSYKNGEEMTVKQRQDTEPYGVWTVEQPVFVYDREYVVLEPVTSAAPTPLSADPLYAAFRQLILDNAEAVRAILPELEASVPLRLTPHVTPLITPPYAVKPLTRAQVIAKAAADVAELLRIGHDVDSELPEPVDFQGVFFSVKLHVNREKRSVTALVFRGCGTFARDVPEAKFTAKCSPADVFHAEIGKAIALRKALGLTVPSEYTDAPQPERAHDYAKVTYANERYTITPGDFKEGTHGTNEATASSQVAREGKITDDTDVDYGAVEAKLSAA
ncbi:hypothetical protein NSS79_10530 [Paenibacillus sp. FSL L8-0436]|uniref:hypothetical protein n=1 Tax=Paenibacillus sp. FSL L8-0436 TaxID=2954686 RepID=UPI0031587895